MEWLEVLDRIRLGETDRTEFKRGLGDGKDARRALTAFGNSEGGLLVLGVDDSGAIVGVEEEPERVSERLTTLLQNGLSAPLQARIGRFHDPAGWVHWVEVPRQRGFEPLRAGGRVWVRRHRSSVEPSPAELQDLYNLFGYIVTEERALEAAGVGEIDESAFQHFLGELGLDLQDEPQPPLTADLANRGVLAELAGEWRATVYGILAFGRRPQGFAQTRSFFVESVAYGGPDRSAEVLSVARAEGRLDEQVERAVSWFRALGHGETYSGLLRRDLLAVPERALREALVNAVAHRDYAVLGSHVLLEVFTQRIDITSPGTLPNHLKPASVMAGGHPRSRNELIANFFLARRMMESRGRGWPIMRRLLREHNGTEPLLHEDRDGPFVRVSFATPAGEPE